MPFKLETNSSFYSTFGTAMAERSWSEEYRYGFNGKERDVDGVGGGLSTYDYGLRIYNPALAKFLSVDPLAKSYAWNSPYSFAENDVIRGVDLDGLEFYYAGDGSLLGEVSGSSEIRVVTASYLNSSRYPTIESYPPFSNDNTQWYERNSTALHTHHSVVIGAVLSTIFKTELADSRPIKVYSTTPNEGALHTSVNDIHVNSKFMGSMKGTNYEIDNYHNMVAILAHEKLHDEYGDDNFDHFKIAKEVYLKYVQGKDVTKGYQDFTRIQMKQYIDGMKLDLSNSIAGAHNSASTADYREKCAESFNYYHQDYENAVDFYNKTYNTDDNAMDFKKYEQSNFKDEESVIKK